MTTKLANVVVNEVSLVKRGANKKKFFLTKSDDQETKTMENEKTPEAIALEKAQADLKVAQEKAVELEKAQTTALEKVQAEKVALETAQAAMVEKTVALEKALAAETESKEVNAAIQKAATDFKNLPEKPDALGPLLRSIRKVDAVAADKIEAVLKKVDELVRQSLDSKGSSVANDKAATAWDEITKRANGLVTAKVAKSFAEGVEKVLAEDKTLYTQHEAEQKASR